MREAELTAVVASVLLQEGMDDADDQEYRDFATGMQQAATQLALAARHEDAAAAADAMTAVSRSCVACHDVYR